MGLKIKKSIRLALIICLLILPLILIFLPATYFDVGESICPSKRLLNMECLGCGITKAIQHLIHFDFKIAWEYNRLSFVVFPLLFYFWLRQIIIYYKHIFQKK